MYFKVLTFLIIHVLINEVDAQSDCGRISLTYVQTEDAVNAKLQFFPNVELSWYRWIHFFSRRKPDFDFLKTIKTNKSKYDYSYKDHVVTIKALQASDEGFYNIECVTQNNNHTFSVNKLKITKPYKLKAELKPSSVADVTKAILTTEHITFESSNAESHGTTSNVPESATNDLSVLAPKNISYSTQKSKYSEITPDDMSESASPTIVQQLTLHKGSQEATEKSKVPESVTDDKSGSASRATVMSLGSPKNTLESRSKAKVLKKSLESDKITPESTEKSKPHESTTGNMSVTVSLTSGGSFKSHIDTPASTQKSKPFESTSSDMFVTVSQTTIKSFKSDMDTPKSKQESKSLESTSGDMSVTVIQTTDKLLESHENTQESIQKSTILENTFDDTSVILSETTVESFELPKNTLESTQKSKVPETTPDMSVTVLSVTEVPVGADKHTHESTEKIEFSKITSGNMSVTGSQTTIEPFSSPNDILDDMDILNRATNTNIEQEKRHAWLDNNILSTIYVIGGCLLIIVIFVISVTIAFRRKRSSINRTESDAEQQQEKTKITINLDTNEVTVISENDQDEDKRQESDVKLQTFVSTGPHEVPRNEVTSVQNVSVETEKPDDEFFKVEEEFKTPVEIDSVTDPNTNEHGEGAKGDIVPKNDEHANVCDNKDDKSEKYTEKETENVQCKLDTTDCEIVEQNKENNVKD